MATDGSTHFMTIDLANQLVAAGSDKLAARNENLKRWCEENGLEFSVWEKIDSDEEASTVLATEIALRFAARRESGG
jgi:hypothetical protein